MALGLVLPASASATFHLTKISEVHPPPPSDPESGFVEIQAYAGGQNLVLGHEITIYDAVGPTSASFTFSANAPNAQTQRTILVGDVDGGPPGGVTPDFKYPLFEELSNAGGAVCFETIDCVAWGTFNTAVLPIGAIVGTPAPAIPEGSSLVRSIAPGCATLLESSDDTDDSATDFVLTTPPTPRANTTAPTEAPCGGGGGALPPETAIDKRPKKNSKKRKARFEFSSPDPAATFECKLDKRAYKPCTSPLKLKIKRGKHVFSVRAVVGGTPDATPAEYRFKRKK